MVVKEMIPGVGQAIAAKNGIGRMNRLVHPQTRMDWLKTGVLGGMVIGALLGGTDAAATEITNPGHGVIESLTLGPGEYCNATAVVQMNDVKTTHSWLPKIPGVSDIPVIGKVAKSPVHATLTETMSGPIAARACMIVSKDDDFTAKRDKNGDYTFDLTASADPKTTDFTFIVYTQDPTKMKFSSDGGNWVSRLDDATFGNVENELSVIPGVHFSGKEDAITLLQEVDLAQGYNYVSEVCGPEIIKDLSATDIPGGNMEQQALADIWSLNPKAKGKVDPSHIHIVTTMDTAHPGVTSEYTQTGTAGGTSVNVFQQIQKENHGLEFPKPSQEPACSDVVKTIGHSS